MELSRIRFDRRVLQEMLQRDIAPLAAFAGATLLIFLFAEIADEVMEGETRALDERVLLALRTSDSADPIGPAWLEQSVADITALGGFAVLTLVTLLAGGYLAVQRKWGGALMLLVATIGGTAISEGLKLGFNRPRPDLVAHVVETTSMSFPSGHAMLSAVTYLTLGALLARTQEKRRLRGYILGAAILVTLLIGLSRIYLGVHWPTDVLAGWCLGAAWAMLCWSIATWLSRRTETSAS
ncbi:phosphatase PAP2 family protein [Vitreimonas sp.]|jgi:undecaprenyl-diphosphatase|uniref:phosphatase PAP2 family protein n=1 Tax=Vitreimonas sp. TaxID=3069702 RepID=UPI002ED86507